jgi:DNA-binding protein H-NS
MSEYHDLLSQIENLKRQAEDVRRNEMSGVVGEIKRLMAQYNLTPEDIGIYSGSMKVKATRAPVPPKYRDPVSGITWTGRGRPPVWVAALQHQGKTLDDCRI